MDDLLNKKCVPCEGGVKPLTHDEIQSNLKKTPGWEHHKDNDVDTISITVQLEDFEQLRMELAKICYVASMENHHPDVLFGYNEIVISFHTHAIGGLSDNDFICAAKINNLLNID